MPIVALRSANNSCSSSPLIARPSMNTSPSSGTSSPDATRRSTDLPEPETPVIQIMCPRSSWKLISSSARLSSKLSDTSRNSIANCSEDMLSQLRDRSRDQECCSSSQTSDERRFQCAPHWPCRSISTFDVTKDEQGHQRHRHRDQQRVVRVANEDIGRKRDQPACHVCASNRQGACSRA